MLKLLWSSEKENNQSGKHSLNITKKTSSKKHLLPSSKADFQYVCKLFQLETKQNFI